MDVYITTLFPRLQDIPIEKQILLPGGTQEIVK